MFTLYKRVGLIIIYNLILPSVIFSQTSIKLSLPDTTIYAGDTILIPVNIDNEISVEDSIISFLISLDFDSSILLPINLVDSGTVVTISKITYNFLESRVILGFYASGSTSDPPLYGKGTLIYIKFYVKSESPIGSYSVLDFSYVTFNGNEYTSNCENGKVTITGVIPVELAYFEACLWNEKILLRWQTFSETNNFGFEIWKSKDNVDFFKIAFIYGKGTTDTINNYFWVDKNTAPGEIYYYKLKQIDYDGTCKFSKVICIVTSKIDEFKHVRIFPNPFNHGTVIEYRLPNGFKGIVKIEIYSLAGQLIKTLVEEEKSAGRFRTFWDGLNNYGQQVSSGIYLCSFIIESKGKILYNSTKKLTLIK